MVYTQRERSLAHMLRTSEFKATFAYFKPKRRHRRFHSIERSIFKLSKNHIVLSLMGGPQYKGLGAFHFVQDLQCSSYFTVKLHSPFQVSSINLGSNLRIADLVKMGYTEISKLKLANVIPYNGFIVESFEASLI